MTEMANDSFEREDLNANRELSIEEVKQLELDILKNVHRYCEERGLIYVLIGGTLLGAIRHKGFIPWDDDIDIAMPRPDYEKFIKEYSDDRYEVKSLEYSDGYIFTFAKVIDSKTILIENKTNKSDIGINIDIFPLDGLPNKKADAVKYANNSMTYKRLITLKQMKFRRGRSVVKNLTLACGKIFLAVFSYKSLTLMAVKYATRYPYNNGDCVANLSWGFGKAEMLDRDGINNRHLVPFEDTEFYISENYEDFLVNRFGDYMQFPPEKDRKSHHLFKAYYK